MILHNPVAGLIEKVPVPGNLLFGVTQPFGCTGNPAEDPLGSCAHFHRGIDLGNGRCGDPILAALAGTVHYAGLTTTHGVSQSVITLEHPGAVATIYIHEATQLVKTGDKVAQDQQIATVGKTGAKACHVHFAVKSGVDFSRMDVIGDSNGKWEDPWPLLAQNNTRTATCAGGFYWSQANSGSKRLGPILAGSKVVVDGQQPGGLWAFRCNGPKVGRSWFRVVEIGGKSVQSLYGQPVIYAATGRFA